MEISHSSWPWHRSDATALAGYANMMPCRTIVYCTVHMQCIPVCTLQHMLQHSARVSYGSTASKWLNAPNWFSAVEYPTLYYKAIRAAAKVRVLLSETLSKTQNFSDFTVFHHGKSTVASVICWMPALFYDTVSMTRCCAMQNLYSWEYVHVRS